MVLDLTRCRGQVSPWLTFKAMSSKGEADCCQLVGQIMHLTEVAHDSVR